MTRGADVGLPQELDAHFSLLDRQIIDPEGRMVAKVDDLELAERFDGFAVTAILIGPGVLGPRLGGRLGEWMAAIWQRLHPDPEPRPGRIPLTDMAGIDSAVHVRRRRAELDVEGFERWVDANVISKLPLVHGEGPGWPEGRGEQLADPRAHRLSGLIGQSVVGPDGRALGRVSDVRLRRDPITDGYVVTELLVNTSRVRSTFGYERPRADLPAAVRFLLRFSGSPAAGRVPWTDVERVDWEERRISCRSGVSVQF